MGNPVVHEDPLDSFESAFQQMVGFHRLSYGICRLVNLLGGSCANLFWEKNWVGITVRSSLSK